ncbi:hypothetical protein FPRO04_11457 [Fusarium proliferatum]|nr:hypothetical protein FPRO03_06801 [Fusarium proliferatum]KAG4270439.1 hypothetical protein FPRO04_11457 [Fusarium proliferatum]
MSPTTTRSPSALQAVEADAELIAALIREDEQARRDFEFARQLDQNPNAIAEADNAVDHIGLDDETYHDVSHLEEVEIQAEDSQINSIQPEDTQEERDADEHPGIAQAAFPAPPDLHVGTKECLYCREEIPEDEVFEALCSHVMCQPCLIRSIHTALKEESLFPPKCCGQVIPVDHTNAFITEELLTEYENKRDEFETANRTYCSDRACSAFIPLSSIHAGIAHCTRCEKRTCLNCLSEAHEGACTDDPESQRVVRLAEEEGWRRCEQCKNIVELTYGCFHICKFIDHLVDAATNSVTYAGDNGEPATVPNGMSVTSGRMEEKLLLLLHKYEQEHEHEQEHQRQQRDLSSPLDAVIEATGLLTVWMAKMSATIVGLRCRNTSCLAQSVNSYFAFAASRLADAS